MYGIGGYLYVNFFWVQTSDIFGESCFEVFCPRYSTGKINHSYLILTVFSQIYHIEKDLYKIV